jgi:hypothetical protein
MSSAQCLEAIALLRNVFFPSYRKDTSADAEVGAFIGSAAVSQAKFLPLQSESELPPVSHPQHATACGEAIDTSYPALLPHWRALLSPLALGAAPEGGYSFALLDDFRMATMALLGTPSPFQVTDDDWQRLAQADTEDFSVYNPGFRDKELEQCVYDRWWDRERSRYMAFDHRYVVGPLTFTTLFRCEAGNIAFWQQGLRDRWRQTMFQFFLLAHLQRASLLLLQQKAAALASRMASKQDESNYLGAIADLHAEMAQFSSRIWIERCTENNQSQELYILLRKQLGLRALYENVLADKQILVEWANATMQARREDWRDKLAPDTLRLAIAALVFSLLGINILIAPAQKACDAMIEALSGVNTASSWYMMARDLLLFGLVAAPCVHLYRRLNSALFPHRKEGYNL